VAIAAHALKLGSRTGTVTPPATGGGGNGPVSGSGGAGGSPSDMCWNLSGVQFTVPTGYTQNGGNTCQVTSEPLASSTSLDMCINIPGVQAALPAGYMRDTGGLCVLNVITNAVQTTPVQTKPTRPVVRPVAQTPSAPAVPLPAPVTTPPNPIERGPASVDIPPLPTEPSSPDATQPPEYIDYNTVPVDPNPAPGTLPGQIVETPVAQADIVHLTFIPRAVQIPIDAPAFREAFRTVLSPRLVNTVLSDPAPGQPAKLDLVSLVLLIGGGSAVTFSAIFTGLKALGLLAMFL
jgi:hypothetical protein